MFRLHYNRPSFITIRVNLEGPSPSNPRQSCVLRNFPSAGHSAHLTLKQYWYLKHKALTAYLQSISCSFLVGHQIPESLFALGQVYFTSGSSAAQYLTDPSHQLSSAIINGKAEEPLEPRKKKKKKITSCWTMTSAFTVVLTRPYKTVSHSVRRVTGFIRTPSLATLSCPLSK